MSTVHQSARLYEDWLREQLQSELVKQDLTKKHEKMQESAFSFLRATYWRWAEAVLDVCPDLASGTPVLAVGDIHFENYGTWRDVDGRLVWGVNDFDEAAEMPYTLDLVRLTASALLGRGTHRIADEEIAAAVLSGYREGLRAPMPVVLDRDRLWLRELVVVSEKERAKFWKKTAVKTSKPAPRTYIEAIAAAMPEPGLAFKTARRTAGVGSLGRPRWVGVADWRGAPLVREAKALVSSAWSRARGRSQAETRAGDLATGRFRSPDPWYRIEGRVVVRRLSPNNRKIEADSKSAMFSAQMLEVMGYDLANVHLGAMDRRDAIRRDLAKRRKGWLQANARQAADATMREYKTWKA